MLDSKRWEKKLDAIKYSKTKLKKELVTIDLDDNKMDSLEKEIATVTEFVRSKISDLSLVDKEKCLYSLSKPVKELSVYPDSFSGKPGENLFKFIEKMEKALASNQVKEGDKVEVLKKYLKGEAKELLAKAEFDNFQAAVDSIHTHFKGHKQRIWSSLLNEYENKAKNVPDRWLRSGPQERKSILSRTCILLGEAEKLAKRDPELAEKVYSDKTAETIMRLNPPEINDKIVHKTKKKRKELKVDTLSHQQKILVMKDILEDYLEDAIEATGFGDALKANANGASRVNQSWKSQQDESLDPKNCKACQSSKKCNTKWGGLGCIELYKIHEFKERSEFLFSKKLCNKCGKLMRYHRKVNEKMRCDIKDLNAALPARCKGLYNGKRCIFGAAICENENHLPNTASEELLDWIKRNNIRSTVTSIFSAPVKTISSHKSHHNPSTTELSKTVRNKLQLGKESVSFTNDQLRELFAKDLKVSQDLVFPMPEGEVSFVFCKIKGKKNGIQAFIDSGCNCAILRDGIPQQELNSCMIQEGPIPIDVATGVVVNALGEWASALPLANGSYQVMRALTVKKVTSDMPKFRLQSLLDDIKNESDAVHNQKLQKIQIPHSLGGEIDLCLGIQFASIHPEPIFSMPNGLTVYKSKFAPVNEDEIACIGGPLAAIDTIVMNAGARSAMRYMSNLINMASKENTPKLEFFPSSDVETDRCLERFTDQGIPQIKEYLNNSVVSNQANVETPDDAMIKTESDGKEPELVMLEGKLYGICSECDEDGEFPHRNPTIQAELKKFLDQQELGLDTTFKCARCRQCKECLKGAGYERMSITQEQHQQKIRESVYIYKNWGEELPSFHS